MASTGWKVAASVSTLQRCSTVATGTAMLSPSQLPVLIKPSWLSCSSNGVPQVAAPAAPACDERFFLSLTSSSSSSTSTTSTSSSSPSSSFSLSTSSSPFTSSSTYASGCRSHFPTGDVVPLSPTHRQTSLTYWNLSVAACAAATAVAAAASAVPTSASGTASPRRNAPFPPLLGPTKAAIARCEVREDVGNTKPVVVAPKDGLLRAWLRRCGGKFHDGTAITDIQGRGSGIVNIGGTTLRAGDVLVEVPWELVVTADKVRKMAWRCSRSSNNNNNNHNNNNDSSNNKSATCSSSGTVKDSPPQKDEESLSCLFRRWIALEKRDPNSLWAEWLKSLPEDPMAGSPALPVALSEEVLRSCQGLLLASQACQLKSQLMAEWRSLPALELELPFEHYAWAHAILSTRSSTVAGKGQRQIQCIIPVVDTANHDSNPNASVVATQSGISLVATRPISVGEEVCISYGDHHADQFLFGFGFLPDGSQLGAIPMPIGKVNKPLFLSPDADGIALLREEYDHDDAALLRLLQSWHAALCYQDRSFKSLILGPITRPSALDELRKMHEEAVGKAIEILELQMMMQQQSPLVAAASAA